MATNATLKTQIHTDSVFCKYGHLRNSLSYEFFNSELFRVGAVPGKPFHNQRIVVTAKLFLDGLVLSKTFFSGFIALPQEYALCILHNNCFEIFPGRSEFLEQLLKFWIMKCVLLLFLIIFLCWAMLSHCWDISESVIL